jgi:hypothetical protein
MKRLNFGGGVNRNITTAETSNRNLMGDDITPEDVIETVRITFTIIEAIKILIASLRNIFKG